MCNNFWLRLKVLLNSEGNPIKRECVNCCSVSILPEANTKKNDKFLGFYYIRSQDLLFCLSFFLKMMTHVQMIGHLHVMCV